MYVLSSCHNFVLSFKAEASVAFREVDITCLLHTHVKANCCCLLEVFGSGVFQPIECTARCFGSFPQIVQHVNRQDELLSFNITFNNIRRCESSVVVTGLLYKGEKYIIYPTAYQCASN